MRPAHRISTVDSAIPLLHVSSMPAWPERLALHSDAATPECGAPGCAGAASHVPDLRRLRRLLRYTVIGSPSRDAKPSWNVAIAALLSSAENSHILVTPRDLDEEMLGAVSEKYHPPAVIISRRSSAARAEVPVDIRKD